MAAFSRSDSERRKKGLSLIIKLLRRLIDAMRVSMVVEVLVKVVFKR